MKSKRNFLSVEFFLLFSVIMLAAQEGKSQTSLRFVENKSQWQQDVDFAVRVPGGNLFIQPGVWRFSFLDEERLQAMHEHGLKGFRESPVPGKSDGCIDGQSMQMTLVGSNPAARANPFGRIPTRYNFFIGNDPEKWGSNAGAFEGVIYQSIYPGIDLKIYSDGFNIKYDFIVGVGADVGTIAEEYQGQSGNLSMTAGNVGIGGSWVSMTAEHPYAYQVINGDKKMIPCSYILNGNRINYVLPQGYDPCYELIIDPLLIFSTYSSSTADNWGSTATPGEKGCLYSSGVTSQYVGGFWPPSPGAFQTASGGLFDVAILKYDSSGQHLLYASYLGGSDDESPHSLVMNDQQELLVLGTTSSADFPTTSGVVDRIFKGGTYQYNVIEYAQGSDLFVSRISKDGSTLLASTLIGGSENDGLNPVGGELVKNYGDELRGDIIPDAQGNVYISSVTSSPDFPAVNSFSSVYHGGSTDAVVMKLNASLTQIIWSAYVGGSGTDAAHTLKLDHLGNLFVAGGTASPDFPSTGGSYQPAYAGSVDGWIAHLAGDGSSILSSTFTGTSNFNQIYVLDLNQQEEVYVYGQTVGSFPVAAGVYSNANSGQFVQKFDNQLSTLLFSTVFGSGRGYPDISPTAFLVNDCNNLYMTGWGGYLNWAEGYWTGYSKDMPITANAFQKTTAGSDFYFMVLTDDAKEFLYGTYMGGSDSRTHVDGGTSRFDKRGIVYHAVCSGCAALNVTGKATSDFPTTLNAYSRTNKSSNCSNAAFKFDLSSLHALIQTNSIHLNLPGFNNVCIPDKIVFQNLSTGGQVFNWNLGDGTTIVKPDTSLIVHQYQQPGTYTVLLKAIDAGTCIGKDSTFAIIHVWMPTGEVGPDGVICKGSSIQLQASGGIQYNWISQDGKFSSQDAQPTVSPADTMRYFVSVTDLSGCTIKDTVKVSVVPGIDLKFTTTKIYDCFSRPSVRVVNFTDPKEVTFIDFGDGSTSSLNNETHEYQRDSTFSVRIVGKKDFCVYDQKVDVPVYELKVPNVITPGSTPGENDAFVILYGGRPISESTLHVSLAIYNRWGGKVLQSDDYQCNWSGENVQAGVYFYEAIVAGEAFCKGWIQVIK